MQLITFKNVRIPVSWFKRIRGSQQQQEQAAETEATTTQTSREATRKADLSFKMSEESGTSGVLTITPSERAREAPTIPAIADEFEKFYYPSYSHYLLHMRRQKAKKRRLYKFIKRKNLITGRLESDEEEEEEEEDPSHQFLSDHGAVNLPSSVMSTEERLARKRQKRKKFEDELVHLMKEEARISTAHGIANLSAETNIYVKVLWALCIGASWSYFVYQFITLILLYTKYEVISSVSVVYEAPTVFPAVDICNLNPYDGNVSRALMLDILAKKNISMNGSISAMQYTDTINNQIKATFENLSEKNNFDLYDAGFNLVQLLISCQYQGNPCNMSDFYPYHDYNYGNCFRFNGGDRYDKTVADYTYRGRDELRKSTKAGWQNGLKLELYTGDPQLQEQFGYKSGFRVIVHNQSIVAFPAEDGIDVATGQQTNIAIQRTFIERLPAPFSNCVEELDEETAKKNAIMERMYELKEQGKVFLYQQQYCMKICYQEFIIQECNCTDLSLAFLNLTTEVDGCYDSEQVSCSNEHGTEFYNSDKVSECFRMCPVECKSIDYELDISVATYPTIWYAALYNESLNSFVNYDSIYVSPPTFDLLQSSQMMINVFYEDMEYTKIEETEAMSFDLLLAGIGGNLGLLSGMSVLSFIEFLEIIIMVVMLVYVHYFK